MKKNFKCLALMAAALLVGFSSCSNDNDNAGDNVDLKTPKNMRITLNLPSTRAEGPAQGKATASFTFGDLYFSNASGIIRAHYAIKSSTTTDLANNLINLTDLSAGVLIKNLPGDAINVCIVGNTKDLPTTGNIGTVKSKSLAIDLQASTEIEGKLVNNVTLFGERVATTDGTTDPVSGNKLYTVTVPLAPTVARIELGSIKGTGDIKSFKVAGVFVDYYYPTATVEGTVDNTTIAKHTTAGEMIDGSKDYPTSLYDWYSDLKASDDDIVVKPTKGAVWGYNVYAGSQVPRIIIRITNIVGVSGNKYPDNQFITIKGLTDSTTNKALTEIKAGSVYSLTSGLDFNEDNITVDPNTGLIDVTVKVEVSEWTVVPVKAIL